MTTPNPRSVQQIPVLTSSDWLGPKAREQFNRVYVPVVNLRCSGCSWRAAVSTLALLNDAARRHDDSPRTQHIVTLNPPGRWPKNDEDFATLTTPARHSS